MIDNDENDSDNLITTGKNEVYYIISGIRVKRFTVMQSNCD